MAVFNYNGFLRGVRSLEIGQDFELRSFERAIKVNLYWGLLLVYFITFEIN